MQELRKTLRKVAAIGASVAMLGMTVTGALAADMSLADYPAPFKNGGDTVVVYGVAGTSEDTAAAGDIISGLPAVAATTTTTTTSTSNAGTVELDQKYSKDLLMGVGLSDSSTAFGSEVRDTTLPGLKNKQVLISIGTVASTSGEASNTYDSHERINFTDTAFLATGLTMGQLNTSGEKYGDNILLRFGQGSMGYYYVFDADLKESNQIGNASSTYPIQLDFLGKTLEITQASTATSLTAIAGDKFNMEVFDSVVINGKKVSVEAIGSSSAKVCVDGQCDTINGATATSQTKTVNGLSIRAQDLIDVGASTSGGKSSVTLVISDATKTAALKSYTNGDYYIGQDKNNPLWTWQLGNLRSTANSRPLIGVTLGQSLTSTSLSIPDYPLSHPPYVGDLLCLPNNYACVTIESISQSDDDAGLFEIKPEIKTVYLSDGTTVDATDAHVMQITSKSTTSGTGLKVNISSGATATSEIYIRTNKSHTLLYRKDTTTSKPLLHAAFGLGGNSGNNNGVVLDGLANSHIMGEVGTIDYKSTSMPLYLFAINSSSNRSFDSVPNSWSGSYLQTGLTNNSALAYAQFKLILNHTSTAADQLQVYFRESSANQLNYLGHRATGGTYQANDILYVPSAGGAVLDVSAYTSNTRGKAGYIVQAPKAGIESDMLRLQLPKDVTNYKAKVTLATTKGGAKASVVKGATPATSSIMMKDEDVLTDLTKYNAIVVGGPAVNKVAAQLLGKEFPAYGANSGLAPNEAVIELKKNGSNYALLVAGWEAADTQRAGVVLKNFASFKDTLKGTSVTVKGTDMTVAGITVA
jgi:hypothetical protein